MHAPFPKPKLPRRPGNRFQLKILDGKWEKIEFRPKGEQHAQRLLRRKQQRKKHRVLEMFRQRRGRDESPNLFRKQRNKFHGQVLYKVYEGSRERSGRDSFIAAS